VTSDRSWLSGLRGDRPLASEGVSTTELNRTYARSLLPGHRCGTSYTEPASWRRNEIPFRRLVVYDSCVPFLSCDQSHYYTVSETANLEIKISSCPILGAWVSSVFLL